MYDVCIVGGGINGIAIAEQCGQQGLKTLVLEKTKLGAGASTKTSKLAHGGLRYLEQLNFGLVREALCERDRLLELHPDHVKPLPFVFPVHKDQFEPKIWLGMKLYDILSGKSKMPKSKKLDLVQTSMHLPWLRIQDVKSGYLFYDAVMDDYSVLMRTVKFAQHCLVDISEGEQVLSFYQDESSAVVITDRRKVTCKMLINATGAWTNQFFDRDVVRPSKGIHIVTDKIYTKCASVLQTPQDKRVFFTIPYKGNTIIGTTDTFYDGDLDNVTATDKDIAYVLTAINTFSKVKIQQRDILDVYAGIRPLANNSNSVFASALGRDTVFIKKHRVLSVFGGKYTTHRAVAKIVLKKIKKYVW